MLIHKSEFYLSAMCRVLNVSRSSFYYWLNGSNNRHLRQQAQQSLDQQVALAFQAERSRSGAIRLVRCLSKQGFHYNLKTAAASLKRQGLREKADRKFKATRQSNHNLPVAANLLKQNIHASQPNQKWIGDIAYLWTDEDWLFLAIVIDFYSHKVIGWSMSEQMTANLVCDALQRAVFRRPPEGVIVHSDR